MIVAFGFKFVVVRSPISGVLDMPGNATEQVSRVHLRKECCLKNKSSAEQAMLLVQRYLDQCKEAAIQQATARIQKCLKRHMMSKFSQAAGVTPPNLVSDSRSDGEIGFLASRDYETKRHHCIRCHYCHYWWECSTSCTNAFMHGYISDGSQDNDIGLMHKAVEGYSSSEDSEMEVIEQTADTYLDMAPLDSAMHDLLAIHQKMASGIPEHGYATLEDTEFLSKMLNKSPCLWSACVNTSDVMQRIYQLPLNMLAKQEIFIMYETIMVEKHAYPEAFLRQTLTQTCMKKKKSRAIQKHLTV